MKILAQLFLVGAALVGTIAVSSPRAPEFSAPIASENIIAFDHEYVSDLTSLDQVAALTAAQRKEFARDKIQSLMAFLFGPATNRSIGSPKRNDSIDVRWDKARLENGRVILPYHYIGVWIMDLEIANHGRFVMPVPRNYSLLFTPGWKKCTDSDPEHATASFYWYFWDPARPGCDQTEGVEYDNVTLLVGIATTQETRSYPEYPRMIHGGELKMTVAFGYVEDPARPNPERDGDIGAYEYRSFLQAARGWGVRWQDTPIELSEYINGAPRGFVLGHRLQAVVHGVPTTLNVVINAGVDQMNLFAKSFAHDHDSVFAWMGHSRVGSGFDAAQFRSLLRARPGYYQVSRDYQLIYWGGCNSYSYYTLPFFEFKAGGEDPLGTKNLDIIANGLPSYFSLNAQNAETLIAAVLNWPARPSYQSILKQLENNASQMGAKVLVAVLGDEDNAVN